MLGQLIQINEKNKSWLEGIILSRVYKREGVNYIRAKNCRLDFKAEFEFKGFTKAGNKIKVSETCTDPNLQYAKIALRKFDHIDGRVFYTIYLYFKGSNYIERLEDVEL